MSNSVELVVVADGPEKFNDAENPVSNTTRPAGSGTSKPKVLSTFELWSHIAIYICLIICVFFFAAFIVAYFVFDREFRERVNAIDNVSYHNLLDLLSYLTFVDLFCYTRLARIMMNMLIS